MIVVFLENGIYLDYIGGMQKYSHFLVKYFWRNRINIDIYTIINFEGKTFRIF